MTAESGTVSSCSPWITSVRSWASAGSAGSVRRETPVPTRTIFSIGRADHSASTARPATEPPNENPASAKGPAGASAATTASMSSNSPRPSSCWPSVAPTPRKLKRSAVQPDCTKARATVCTTLFSMVPPYKGCGCAITAVPREGASVIGWSRSMSMAPTGPASWKRRVWEFMRSAPQVRGCQQAFDHLPILEVRFDDLVDVVLVDIGVPDRFGVDHDHGPRGAAVEAAGLVDADLARTGQALRLHLCLAPVKRLLGMVLGTTGLTVLALVQAKEDVALVIGIRVAHAAILFCGSLRETRTST